MTTTEERIAAALSARARGITMDTNTIDKRFAEVREQGVKDRRRRRGLAVGAAALATAAVVAGAFTLGDGLLGDESAAPDVADRVDTVPDPAPGVPQQVVTEEVFPAPGSAYVAQDFAVPFSLQVPDKGEVPGRWRMGPPEEISAGVGLDASPSTGHAAVDLSVLEQVYRPDVPWKEQTSLVPAPQDADGWAQWFTDTGYAQVSDREAVQVDGLPAERMLVTVADDLPAAYDGCAPSLGCLGMRPFREVGTGFQAGLFEGMVAEMTVLQVGDKTVLISASGATPTTDLWLPLLRQVVDSIDLL